VLSHGASEAKAVKHDTLIDDDVLRDFARRIADLRYDQLCDFLRHLAKKISDDSKNDRQMNRKKLAQALSLTSSSLFIAADLIADAWDICEPKMCSGNCVGDPDNYGCTCV
jgi:hypothetical protein